MSKLEKFKAGMYYFPAAYLPSSAHYYWNTNDWIKFIDAYGGWK